MKKVFLFSLALFACIPDMGLSAKNDMRDAGKTRSENFVCENETEWEVIGDGVERQILGYDGQLMMVKIKAGKKGPVGVEHAHYHSQVTYVASGKFEFVIGGKKKVVSAGDGLYMEPDAVHGCTCLEPGVIVDCFSPMRPDFLKK